MKKILHKGIVVFLTCFLAACLGKPNSSIDASGFSWTREGYYIDEDDNFLNVMVSTDEEHPGWYVGCVLGDDMYGWYIQQEGKTLHGNLASYGDESNPFVVTLSEEGEDGIKLETQDGTTYSFSPKTTETARIIVYVNAKGSGQITTVEEGEELIFDEEYPSQSSYIGLAEPKTYTFGAKPDEGWKFLKWTVNGEDFSEDNPVTVELTENREYIAVFGIAGKDETPVDLEKASTLGELLGLPDYGLAVYDKAVVYAFEQDGIYYRAIADLSSEASDALSKLDFEDPEYESKYNALISPLPLKRIENLTEMIPSEKDLSQYIGKTGKDLIDEGWTIHGWSLEDMEFNMSQGPFTYTVYFEGSISSTDTIEDEDILPLKVKLIVYEDIGDPTNIDEDE